MKLWVARDKDGVICLYKDKPQLDIYYWYDFSCGKDGCIAELSKDSFPEVTFENSPKEVELKLI